MYVRTTVVRQHSIEYGVSIRIKRENRVQGGNRILDRGQIINTGNKTVEVLNDEVITFQ